MLPCVIIVVGALFPGHVRCADGSSGAALPILTELIYGRLYNLTSLFRPDIKRSLGFCIKDVWIEITLDFRDKEWNGAFNFTGKLDFVTNCIKKKGDISRRVCTAAEIKLYFTSFYVHGPLITNYVKPNKNCNLTSWAPGCEPGWGCSVVEGNKVEIRDSKNVPLRVDDCQPCCEGFFCPQGLTCMIPCPLGAYCPLAKLNKTTGNCDPYGYQISPGQHNQSCGGADIWADATSSSEIFCSGGSYCPTTIRKIDCSSGHYCRKGSTAESPCFKLTTCPKSTATQNIHAYGILLIVGLSTLLIIIYNCSDQVLITREKRKAKSREAAARHARETAQARERWKSAKDVAKQHAFGLQEQFSRTFSRRKSTKSDHMLKIFGQSKKSSESSSLGSAFSNLTKGSEAPPKDKGKQPGNLTKMIQSIDDDPNSHEGFNLQIGDKNLKKQHMPKGKQLHTKSQIFKYAYGQIEKEKAMQQENKNLTFSGVISMATDDEARTRPVIEVAFKDLTLTLKGKNKPLLKSVTGKISPGRVSAVMGPSGAGKTTFLSALTGKATGCYVTGMILINGKNESIDSYRKIIGFVPQDDIVHGNLTVEENLRFSARCRLADDLPKADKVLTIERVIESLGLQPVRDSLVGTVEKRGISGGQRKRVNVGLEMVMEPSLLILDEPTSGLDSSSSLLLLRALRREALEGVNICMVVHQPSYSLFKMFDDLILLAKGGLIAYLGSVKKVEEYFSSIGITVPERVNPPDHFIDILEGIVKPPNDLTIEQFPVRWMLHNGYPVPPDMLKLIDGLSTSSSGLNSGGAPNLNSQGTDQSFAGDLWQDVVCNVKLKQDHLQHNFMPSKDLSGRITPGTLRQYRYYLGRVGKQRLREAEIQAMDYLILLLAGACLGTLAKVDEESFGVLGYTYSVIAVSLLCKISALRSFTLDRLEYLRESSAGMSSLAYFLSKDTVDHFNTIVKPLVYLSMFYFYSDPRSSFTDNYVVLLCLVYCVTGIAYILAIYLDPGPAQLWSVLIPVVMTLIATQEKESSLVTHLADLCYPKWALEGFIIANSERYSGVWLITRCGSLMQNGYDLNDWNLCLIILILTGAVSRCIAFVCLMTKRKK
ncbi:hypothetical protein SAY87_032371 [Trapa incisa]|uniref:ABC transporter domain-containing protein n=1 Tax=Trapa incisa TaxID=236973 RepID=A0AAN7GFH4_9MYRT|nr:hypothetical protein SAY87_032371 [Trapa incisa]